MHKCLKIHSRIITLSIRNSLYHQHLYKKRFPRSNNSKNCEFFVTSFLQQMNGIIELRSCEICIGDTDRNSWGVTSGYQDSILFFFSRIHPSCRFGTRESHMPARWPDASTFGWLMFAVVSPTRLHKSKGALTSANPFLAAHLSYSFSFYIPIHSVRRRGCVIKSVDDRRERIKYRTGRAHRLSSEGWKRWEVNERARASSPRLPSIQICFLPFFAVPQPPRRLCVPGRLFFAYYSLLRGY